jgi:flagellar basal-body rod protein FlgG
VVNPSGYSLLGTRGQIRLTTDQMHVDSQGAVYDGEQLVDSLRIVEFDTPVGLSKLGDGLIVGAVPRLAAGYEIIQGAVEGSNVQVVTELQRMMTSMRLYEANARVLQTQDETIGSLLREAVG